MAPGAALVSLLDPFLSLLYPPRCAVCRTLGAGCLCEGCAAEFTPVPQPWCGRCGHGLPPEGRCLNCAGRTPAFARARSFGAFEGTLREAIHRFKYQDRPQLAEPLGALLADFARAQSASLNDLHFDALVPVPMHPIRRRLRGYNQSERLARVVARTLDLPMEPHVLRRTRHTRPQVGLSSADRQQNLRGAFQAPRPGAVAGKTLLLIDDVATTNSTLGECAATLRAAGAKAVYALTLAAG